ncbi:MAG: trimethylamine methyltransferase family protein [Candidatus Latescibacter sp.]|nr:trimethylamine methyltransferase family protein [Candidatus Latescibacter sp.]
MKSNSFAFETPQFRILSDNQIEEIHSASLEILERTGVLVLEEESRSLLGDAGGRVEPDGRVRIPSWLVEKALVTAPKRVTLCGRDGSRKVHLEGCKSWFGTGSDCPNIIDPFTREKRRMVREDIAAAARLCDWLPNIDFIMSLGLVSDAPWEISDKHQFEAMLLNNTKPIVFTAHDRAGMNGIIEMSSLVAGSEENLRKNPFICLYAEPVSPLKHVGTALRKLLLAAEKEIPVVYTPCPMSGATAPVTMAGVLALGNAECLSGLVIHQLKKPGAPFITGGVISILDMRDAVLSYGAPELDLLSAAMADIAHFYRLPVFGTAGCSDSKVLDEQAAVEASISTLMSALSGSNLVHDIGFLESALTGSLELIVLTNEIVDMVRRIMRGIQVTPETLALDLIDKVGPGGHFIAEEHTAFNFRKEFWLPHLMDRRRFDTWHREGEKTLGVRLNEEVKRILKEHTPEQLPEGMVKEIHKIRDAAV